MKITFVLLLAFSLCNLGGYTRRSFMENHYDIDLARRTAFADYAQKNNVEEDDLIPITVHSQVVNGINMLITFADSKNFKNEVHEYEIHVKTFGGNSNGPQILNIATRKVSEDFVSMADRRFPKVHSELFKYYNEEKNSKLEYVKSINTIETNLSTFFICVAKTDKGEFTYIVEQDKESKKFQVVKI